MSHFKFKSLVFYSATIGGVVILFNGVTAYGENQLKAPPPIGGSYQISTQNLPICLKPDRLVLTIQQSGIYLFGSLLSAKTEGKTASAAEEKPSLTGRMSNQQLILEGLVPGIANCNPSLQQATTSVGSISVKIQGVVKGETLIGQITLSSIPKAVEFTSQREAAVEQPGNKH